MSTSSLEDRFKAIQDHCHEERIVLCLVYDPVENKWHSYEDDVVLLTDPCDSWEELIEALEAEFQL